MNKNNKVVIIAGPTGSGESTITNEIVARHPIFQRLVTATSRPMRSGEQNERDYYFFSKEEFKKMVESGLILEHTYIENRDTFYGTYKPDFEQKNSEGNVIVNVDHVGTQYYKENFGAISIFIKPKSIESLALRLKARNPEMTENELEKRLENAKSEIENEEKYYDFKVVNEDGKLEAAISEVENVLRKNGFEF